MHELGDLNADGKPTTADVIVLDTTVPIGAGAGAVTLAQLHRTLLDVYEDEVDAASGRSLGSGGT